MARENYRLWPSGPEGHLDGPHRLAIAAGCVVAKQVQDRVQIWLAREDGELLATMWPGEYRARLNPLELLDDQNCVVARGGEKIKVVGGYLPADDPRAAQHSPMFSASRILHEPT